MDGKMSVNYDMIVDYVILILCHNDLDRVIKG
jgi:hypothetical protein